jgi:hypothetical protein
VSENEPITNLPEHITFNLDEVARILFAIDLAVELTRPGNDEQASARTAQRLVTARLWPDLDDLLDDDGNE